VTGKRGLFVIPFRSEGGNNETTYIRKKREGKDERGPRTIRKRKRDNEQY